MKEHHTTQAWLAELEFLNIEEGLRFCGEDPDFYRNLLIAFCERNLSRDLQHYCNEMDLDNYRIVVHGLKCTARAVGAMELAQQAQKLEEAAARQDDWFVHVYHDEMFDAYHGVMMGIARAFGEV